MNDSGIKEIQLWARIHQYHLDPFALKRLSNFLDGVNFERPDDRRSLLQDIFAILKRQLAGDRSISLGRMEEAIRMQVEKIKGSSESSKKPSVTLISLPQVPRVRVHELSEELTSVVSSAAEAHNGRQEALRNRFLMAHRRCVRSGLYRRNTKSTLGNLEKTPPLLSSSSLEGIPPNMVVSVLGLLVYRDGGYYLEDLRGVVPLYFEKEVTQLCSHNFVAEGYIVVVTGMWSGVHLNALRLGLPPAERREVTLKDVGPATDLFGLPPSNFEMALQAEKQAVQSVIVVLAHIHLDKAETMIQLSNFFSTMEQRGVEELSDTTFVLVGNFTSISLPYVGSSHLSDGEVQKGHLQQLLDQLGNCIAATSPTAAHHSHFILIPGPQDCSLLNGVLPQPPFPSMFVVGLSKKVRHVELAPNPCRLRFMTQEIVISRRDYMRCFKRSERQCWANRSAGSFALQSSHQLISSSSHTDPNEEEEHHIGQVTVEEFERVAKTVLDEAHLCPDVLDGGILWRVDDALRLPVLPHLLLLCDVVEQWECFYKGVHILNPGSFSVTGTFLWYTPADQECTISRLN